MEFGLKTQEEEKLEEKSKAPGESSSVQRTVCGYDAA